MLLIRASPTVLLEKLVIRVLLSNELIELTIDRQNSSFEMPLIIVVLRVGLIERSIAPTIVPNAPSASIDAPPSLLRPRQSRTACAMPCASLIILFASTAVSSASGLRGRHLAPLASFAAVAER